MSCLTPIAQMGKVRPLRVACLQQRSLLRLKLEPHLWIALDCQATGGRCKYRGKDRDIKGLPGSRHIPGKKGGQSRALVARVGKGGVSEAGREGDCRLGVNQHLSQFPP